MILPHRPPILLLKASRRELLTSFSDMLPAALVQECLTQRCPYESTLSLACCPLSITLWHLGTIIFFLNLIHVFTYWNIIALPYCISFCFTTSWILYKHTYALSLLLLLPPLGVHYYWNHCLLQDHPPVWSPTQALWMKPSVWFEFFYIFFNLFQL